MRISLIANIENKEKPICHIAKQMAQQAHDHNFTPPVPIHPG